MGFAATPLTLIHTLISLVGIASGLVVLYGLLTSQRMPAWTAVFLAFTVATSVTGYFFPIHGFTPAIGVGIISLVILAVALAGRYAFHLAGPWRWIYAATATAALYLNTFVLVVQLFLKVPALHALAPKGSEPPFAITQGLVLLFFVVSGVGGGGGGGGAAAPRGRAGGVTVPSGRRLTRFRGSSPSGRRRPPGCRRCGSSRRPRRGRRQGLRCRSGSPGGRAG